MTKTNIRRRIFFVRSACLQIERNFSSLNGPSLC